MDTEKKSLTRKSIDSLPLTKSGQRVYRFIEPPGLLMVVGKRTKTFAFQSDANGTSRRVALGRYPFLSMDAARIRALDLASQVARGRAIAPNPRITLQDGMDAYLRDRKGLSDKTKRYTRSLFTLYLHDWLKKPMAAITPKMVLDKHAAIAKRIKEQPRYENATYDGTATANDVMRKLRVVWNHVSAMDMDFPANPVRQLSAAKAWIGPHATEIIQDAVQLHGGIGVTWEHDLHLYLRRATVNRATYGTPEEHAERVATIILGAAS